MKEPPPLFNERRLRIAGLVFPAAEHKLRLSLLEFIQKRDKVTLKEAASGTNIEEGILARHFAILRRAGILMSQREAKDIYYMIDYERIHAINQAIDLLHIL